MNNKQQKFSLIFLMLLLSSAFLIGCGNQDKSAASYENSIILQNVEPIAQAAIEDKTVQSSENHIKIVKLTKVTNEVNIKNNIVKKTETKVQSKPNVQSKNNSSASKGLWKSIYQKNISFPCCLVAFLSDKYALAVGPDDELHYSNDGGKTWPRANFRATERLGLDIINDKLSYTSGLYNLVMKTTDGGKNWTELPQSNIVGKFLSFVNQNTGFMASSFELEKTKDGAKTWTKLKVPDGMGEISTISFTSENQGYLLDCNGYLYKTNDGCKTWTKSKIFSNNTILTGNKNQTAALGFSDKLHGIAICCMESGKTLAYITSDGGKTWKQEKLPENIKSDFGFTIYLSRDKKTFTFLDMVSGDVFALKHN